jgi:hypothetical protein
LMHAKFQSPEKTMHVIKAEISRQS